MNSFLWVVFAVLGILLWMVFMYLKARGKIALDHQNKIAQLHLEYAIHEQQMERRQADLSIYDFTKYNLSESLNPQFEIKL